MRITIRPETGMEFTTEWHEKIGMICILVVVIIGLYICQKPSNFKSKNSEFHSV